MLPGVRRAPSTVRQHLSHSLVAAVAGAAASSRAEAAQGGGAVQITARSEITVTAQGQILATGGGGKGGKALEYISECGWKGGGGGGGSGGAILLEAPHVAVQGRLSVNGGGGGAGGAGGNVPVAERHGADGSQGGSGFDAAEGGPAGLCGGAGGNGASPNTPAGTLGDDHPYDAGGGGGGLGRITLRGGALVLGEQVPPQAHVLRLQPIAR